MDKPRRSRIRLCWALAVPLTALSLLAPPSAGAAGLNDFFKKGERDTRRGADSPRVETDRSSRREGSPSLYDKERRRDTRPSLYDKERRDAPTPSKDAEAGERRGPDLFRKEARPQPLPYPSAERQAPGTGGGLVDIFRKPAPRESARPHHHGTRPPAIVVYRYYDPWYYPYDRHFYQDYCPHILGVYDYWVSSYNYYYNTRERDEEAIARALRSIELGWEGRDYGLIDRYVHRDRPIQIHQDGVFSHSMTAREFQAMTLQAMNDLRTVRFRFFSPRSFGHEEVRADGEHVFVGPDGVERRVEVTYTLRKDRGRWHIMAVDMHERARLGALTPGERVLTVAALPTDTRRNFTFAGPRVETVTDVATPMLALSTPAAAAPAAAADPRLGSLRITCTSNAVSLASLRSSGKVVKAATLVYRVAGAKNQRVTLPAMADGAPVLMTAGTRATYEVRLKAVEGGIAWSVVHPHSVARFGESAPRESGVIPLAQLPKGAAYLHVSVDRLATPIALAPTGAQRVRLFARHSWDFQTVLLASTSRPGSAALRSELLISGQ